MRLWLARHANPLIASGVCYGCTDMPADPEATGHAARCLAAVLPPGGMVATSPLLRCRQLADALQSLRPDLTLQVWTCLREVDFGSWEGCAWADIDPRALTAWTDDFEHYRGHGGESVAQVIERVSHALQLTRDLQNAAPEGMLWVTHAGVLRALALLLGKVQRPLCAAAWPRAVLSPGDYKCISI